MPEYWPDEERGVVTERETRQKTEKPRLYKVLLHNDNYTTMDFVVLVLTNVFRKSQGQAVQIMLDVHRKGIGVAGVYSREIAETKIAQVTYMAQQAHFPLLCTLEPE